MLPYVRDSRVDVSCANCLPIRPVSVSDPSCGLRAQLLVAVVMIHYCRAGISGAQIRLPTDLSTLPVDLHSHYVGRPPRGRFSHLAMFRIGAMLFIPSYLSVILYRVFASASDDGNLILMSGVFVFPLLYIIRMLTVIRSLGPEHVRYVVIFTAPASSFASVPFEI